MKLIVTADDFGRSSAINAAVLEAHQRGILTSASLMVAGEAFEEAVQIARQTPTLAVGLHVVIVDGKAVLPPAKIGRLVDHDGFFPNAPTSLGMRYFFDPRCRRQLAAEVTAQFERFAATGLKLSHVDGHQHLHVHPAVFPLIVKLAERYNAAGVRLPRDDAKLALRCDGRERLAKIGRWFSLALMSRWCRRILRRSKLAAADAVYGLLQSGQMEEAYVLEVLRQMRDESAEIYFHPTTGPRTDALGPNPQELQTLVSPLVRQLVAERKITLSTYADLVAR